MKVRGGLSECLFHSRRRRVEWSQPPLVGWSEVLSAARDLPTCCLIQCRPPPRQWIVPESQAFHRAPSCSKKKKKKKLWVDSVENSELWYNSVFWGNAATFGEILVGTFSYLMRKVTIPLYENCESQAQPRLVCVFILLSSGHKHHLIITRDNKCLSCDNWIHLCLFKGLKYFFSHGNRITRSVLKFVLFSAVFWSVNSQV